MYLALLKLFGLLLEAIDWVRFHALRYFASPIFQSGSGNVGERAAKLPLSDWRYPITIVFALIEAVVLIVWQIFKWLFFFNTRNIFEFCLSGVKVVIVLSVLSVVGLYGYLLGDPDPEVLSHYKALHQQHTATALLGGDGKIIGAVPNPKSRTGNKAPGSLYAEMVPPVYWDILDYKTQRQLDFNHKNTRFLDVLTWRQTHYKGISLTSLFNTINPFSSPSSQGLVGQLAVNLNGGETTMVNRCMALLQDLCRTLSSIRLAKHAFPYLANNKGSEFKRWVAIHGTLRGFSNDIAGLRATADVVFNKKPEKLTSAEQALMAIAQLRNQPLLDTPDISVLTQDAITTSRELYAKNQPALAANIEQGLRKVDFSTASRLQALSRGAVTVPSNLLTRSATTLGNFVKLVEQRIAKQYELIGHQRIISDAQITLPVRKNEAFQQSLLSSLQRLQAECRDCGLNYTLGAATSDGGAAIEVLVANQKGQIVRYFKRGDVKDRAVGELSSMPAAVLLTTLGNVPESRFCNQTYQNLPSSVDAFPRGLVNCQTLDQPGHSLSFQQAIQVRSSLPLFNALRKQTNTTQLQALYRDFGLVDLRTRARNPTHGEQLAYEMSYGAVQSTPLHQLDVIHQLGNVLYGRAESKAVRGISQFLVSDLTGDGRYLEFNKTNSDVVINSRYLRTEAAKKSLIQLLSYDTNSRNAALKSLLNIKNGKFLLTKTGKGYTKKQTLRDQWLVASVLIRGKRYSISAFIGSPTAGQVGLAKQLTAAKVFRPIMAEIIDSLD